MSDAIYEPAASTIGRQLVRTEDLPAFGGAIQTGTRLGTMLGAAVGGFLVAPAGIEGSASINAVTFVAVVAFLAIWLRPRYPLERLHPCFPGLRDGASHQLSSWPPDRGYSTAGWWTTHSDGVRGRVGAYHRMLSTYLNAVLRAGFDFDEFAEPTSSMPRYFIARCLRRDA